MAEGRFRGGGRVQREITVLKVHNELRLRQLSDIVALYHYSLIPFGLQACVSICAPHQTASAACWGFNSLSRCLCLDTTRPGISSCSFRASGEYRRDKNKFECKESQQSQGCYRRLVVAANTWKKKKKNKVILQTPCCETEPPISDSMEETTKALCFILHRHSQQQGVFVLLHEWSRCAAHL